jgi:hypothetical protein
LIYAAATVVTEKIIKPGKKVKDRRKENHNTKTNKQLEKRTVHTY